MPYRIYLHTVDGQISEKTVTKAKDAAAAAFAALVGRTDLDGQKLAAVLTYNGKQLAFHRFDRNPGDRDYWRDRLDEIKRPSVGRPAEMVDGRRINVYLDAESIAIAASLGSGNVSDGIRKALKQAACRTA